MSAVSVKELRKSYADVEAVRGISFDVKEGSFFAFLGPNGAGKSTTISMICSLLKQDSGSIEIFGKTPENAKTDIGVVFQDHMLDPNLTVYENVSLKGMMYGLKDEELKESVNRALKAMGADEIRDRRYGKLSGGQKRRADIARALVHNPGMLILDEPTSGLDPQSRKALWNAVFDLNRNYGTTIFLTTHYMEEAAEANDIVIMNRGNIVAHGTSDELKAMYCTDFIRAVPKDRNVLKEILNSKGIGYTDDREAFIIPVADSFESLPLLESIKSSLLSFEVRTGTLDDAFIRITGDVTDD